MDMIATDPAQRAADAASPLFYRTVKELELGPEKAERLVLEMVELYLRGRTDGANEFARQMNLALAADDIAAAVRITDGSVRPGTARDMARG